MCDDYLHGKPIVTLHAVRPKISVNPQRYVPTPDYIQLSITWRHTESASNLRECHTDTFERLLRYRTVPIVNSIGLVDLNALRVHFGQVAELQTILSRQHTCY